MKHGSNVSPLEWQTTDIKYMKTNVNIFIIAEKINDFVNKISHMLYL